jgi:hypothetical protein
LVFGRVECGSKLWFGEGIVERNREILIELVRKYIKPGTILHSDQWVVYYSSDLIYPHWNG